MYSLDQVITRSLFLPIYTIALSSWLLALSIPLSRSLLLASFCSSLVRTVMMLLNVVLTDYSDRVPYTLSSMVGSQKAILVHAEASIMYLGLNWIHCTGAG